MRQKIIVVLLVLASLAVFSLNYWPMPVRFDASRYTPLELAKPLLLIVLLLAWGAALAHWSIGAVRCGWRPRIGIVLLVLGLAAEISLYYLPVRMPIHFGLMDSLQQYALLTQYPALPLSAFVLMVVGTTMMCWRSKPGQEMKRARIEAETPAISQSDAFCEQAAVDGEEGRASHEHRGRKHQRVCD